MTRWLLATAGLILFTSVARADVPLPPKMLCGGKPAGTECIVDGKEGTCQKGRYPYIHATDGTVIETEGMVCKPNPPKAKEPEKSKDKKKSALGADGARGSLALALLACGAGVLMARRRHARP